MEKFTESHWDILLCTLSTFVAWTHFKWVSSKPQREKLQHYLHDLLLVWAERDARGWAGGSTQILWLWNCCGSGTWLWGCVGLIYSGACAASALLSSPSTALDKPPYSPRGQVVFLGAQFWSSYSPTGSRNPHGFCPGCHLEPAELCSVSSPHTCVKLYSFLYSKGKPLQPSKPHFQGTAVACISQCQHLQMIQALQKCRFCWAAAIFIAVFIYFYRRVGCNRNAVTASLRFCVCSHISFLSHLENQED